MHSATRITVSVFLITSAIATAQQNSAKLRRDGVLNLYPFPRVGRSSHTWQIPLNYMYPEQQLNDKRQLYAFPRVGRDNPMSAELLQDRIQAQARLEDMLLGRVRQHAHVKRGESEGTDSTGMWFGPRLGRSFKNGEDDITFPENERSEPELTDMDQNENRQMRQTKY